jgi:hypothetical protein
MAAYRIFSAQILSGRWPALDTASIRPPPVFHKNRVFARTFCSKGATHVQIWFFALLEAAVQARSSLHASPIEPCC